MNAIKQRLLLSTLEIGYYLSFPKTLHTTACCWKLPNSVSVCGRSHTTNGFSSKRTHDLLDFKICKVPRSGTCTISKFSRLNYLLTKQITRDSTNANSESISSSRIKKGDKFIAAARSLVTMSEKGPGLIVFDLDCTLWPHHVDTTVNPPFIQQNSNVVDQDGEAITYYPEVPKVLDYLQSEGYTLAAASRTTKPPAAEQLLQFFDWNKYFKYKEIYPGSKVTHFAKFVEKTNIPHKEMLFFDDEQRNIIDMQKEGVKCVFVKNGVNLQLVKESIEKFKNGAL